jgi:hypothetical protein
LKVARVFIRVRACRPEFRALLQTRKRWPSQLPRRNRRALPGQVRCNPTLPHQPFPTSPVLQLALALEGSARFHSRACVQA